MMSAEYDLVVIGGGINGVGIGRDAQGRGMRTLVVEKDDLGGGTSVLQPNSSTVACGTLKPMSSKWLAKP